MISTNQAYDPPPPDELEALYRRVSTRIALPLILLYDVAFLDRVNISFAALTMNRDLGISEHAFGIAAGVFFAGYLCFGVPSNVGLVRFGVRTWLSFLLVLWGLISVSFAFVASTKVYVVLRFLLGAAESGFFPSVIFYLSCWLPAAARARAMALFVVAIPVSMFVGSPLSAYILRLDGLAHLKGWQLLFVFEGVPAIVLGACLRWFIYPDPDRVSWLSVRQKGILRSQIERERNVSPIADAPQRSMYSSETLRFSAIYFFLMIGLYELGFWVPKLLSRLGVGGSLLGWSTALPFACGGVGMLIWSRYADRSSALLRHLAGALVVASGGFLFAAKGNVAAVAVTGLSIAAVGVFSAMPVFWSSFAAAVPAERRSGGIALVNSVGNLGGFIGPLMTGALAERTHAYGSGLVAAAIGLASAAGLCWWASSTQVRESS